MIHFTGEPGDKNCKILFTRRPAFRDDPKAPDLERELVYGHRCPTCGNVIQAMFRTETPVDLWKYEETAFISKSTDAKKFGMVNKFVPNEDSKLGYSQYDSTFQSCFKPGTQHLVMRNHILQYQGLMKSERDAGRHVLPGGFPCAYTGTFSRRPELAVQDMYLFFGHDMGTVLNQMMKNELPTLDELGTSSHAVGYGIRTIVAYGDAPPVLTFPIEKIQFVNKNGLAYQLVGMAYYIRRDRKQVAA
jgi:hypothetical protein